MIIGINARPLLDLYTGIGQYTLNLLKEFDKISKEESLKNADSKNSLNADYSSIKFLVVVPDESCANILRKELIQLDIRVLPEILWLSPGIRKHYWEQIQLPRFFNGHHDDSGQHIDTVFLPYVSPPWLIRYNARTFMTVHDAIPWTDDTYQTGLLSRLSHAIAKHSLKRIDQLITVSHAAAKDIAVATGISEEKLKVIYNAPGRIFQEGQFSKEEPEKSEQSAQTPSKILQQYDLTPNNYALYVGGYDKRKNVKRLTEMWEKYGPEAQLVLVGGKIRDTSLYDDYPNAYPTDAFPLSDAKNSLTNFNESATTKVVQTGFLDEESLAEIYRGARVFLHFSQKEGFNIPITEAMATHTPMLLSDTPVHREIAGTGASYVDPSDEVAVKNAINQIWNDEKLRDELKEQCVSTAKNFSWEKSSRNYLDLFMKS